MKKRVVSWLLVVLMLTSLLPTSVLAEMAEGAAQTPAAEEVLPETPEVPESPESPETPEESAQPETPEQPEQPEGEEQTSAPQLAPQSAAIAVQALSGSGKADDPYRITSAEDFAAITSSNNSGYFKLTSDITVTKPCGTTFRGTFDGDGHTVTLTLNVTSGNAGLFGETGGGAVIKNLTVDADVTSTAGSNYAATAGLVGKVSGSTTVENCGVTGTASNTSTSSSPVYVGGLIGYLTGNCTVTNSYSQATVSNTNSASSSSTGGFLGKTSNYCTLTVKNCYSSGDVTANKGYAGGFTGYVYCSSSYKHIYENCYAAGTVQVTGASSNACGFAYSYAYSGYTFTTCYYNNSANTSGCNRSDAGIAGKTADELKGLAGELGEAYQGDATPNINGGYPILTWQYNDPDATPTVTVTVTPADAKFVWDGEEQTGGANGVYTLKAQTQGAHTYTVSHEAGDYAAQTGTITVKSSDMNKTFTLALNRHKLTFTGLPVDAELIVKSGTDTLKAESDGSYAVTNGTYSYTVTKFGYVDAEGTVTVDRADAVQPITMTRAPSATVRFDYAKDAAPTIKVAYASAWNNKVIMSASADGSYLLPVGYAYDWTFESDSYITQTGTVDLTKVAADATETVDVTMSKKPAGTGDAAAPYQITDASQLRWFAQQVNDGRSSICAVLTKDIDLGDEPWTPIGQYARNAYKGVFDGQGYTIKRLKITGSTSNHYGLFGVVGSGTVRNLTVEGTVTVTGSTNAYSTYGIAGIVGAMNDGTTGTVENCVNKATISGTQNVGGIVGYISSGYTAGKRVIQNCANYGDISSTCNDAGGIVGNVSGAVTIQNCYNHGTISGGNWRAGGIVSFLSSSYGKALNCYTIGKATAKKGDFAQVVGKKNSGTITNCYYLSTLGTDSNATAVTETELKAVPKGLGDAFVAAPKGLNDGYPVLRWQIPTYAVTFTVAPADAVVTIDGQTGTHTGNQWVFKLPDGTYTYTVSAFGYVQQSDTVTVSSKALAKDVTLTAAAKRTVTFTVTPTDAKAAVTVTWDGDGRTVAAQSDGSYLLPEGAYTYTVKAKGYAKASGTLNVTKDKTISVTLTPSTAWDGETRDEKPNGEGTEVAPYQIGSGAERRGWRTRSTTPPVLRSSMWC